MANSNNYLAPLGLAVVGALFGIGHFGGLHDSIFGSDNSPKEITESYYDYEDSYSSLSGSQITFRGHDTNSDGYIPKGTISLERVSSGIHDSFYLFNKGGVDYVSTSKSGPYLRLSRRMTINYIDYKY